MTPTPPHPTDCAAFEAVVQRVFDRELGPESLDDLHPSACAECRRLAAAANVLATGLDRMRPGPRVEAARTERIASASVADHRYRRRVVWAGRTAGVALAASVLIVVIVYSFGAGGPKQPEVAHVVPPPGPRPVPPPALAPERLEDRMADATSALASITKKATDRTLTSPRHLIPPTERVSLPDSELAATVEPAAETLSTMPQTAKSGIEPMTTGARRAVNLFLRDTGIAPKPKS